MTEETQIQDEQKNTVATVGMWFSIIGLILLITVFFSWLGLVLLFIGLILGIVGLFYKPRGKARVAVCIPLVILIALVLVVCYIWSSVKTPMKEWYDWTKVNVEQLYSDENYDGDRFGRILEGEFNKLTSSISGDVETFVKNSTGSNTIEKWSYFGFGLIQQAFENAIEKYNNGEDPEILEGSNIIDVDIDVNIDEKDEDEKKEDDSESKPVEHEEVTVAQPKKSNNETFTQSEKNDIEQILDILE